MTLASTYAAATFAGRCYKLKRIKETETDCVTETAAVTAIASLCTAIYVCTTWLVTYDFHPRSCVSRSNVVVSSPPITPNEAALPFCAEGMVSVTNNVVT